MHNNRMALKRIAIAVADAQNFERSAMRHERIGMVYHASEDYRDAALTLKNVLFHGSKRDRREVARHVDRLMVKARRIYRAAAKAPYPVGGH